MTAIDRVKIMVLGDSGVGKTSFVHLAAHNEPLKSPSWTIGCSVEVKLHEFKEGTKDQQTYFIEFWDVGGSSNHRNTRPVFYNPCHGVILVHDLTNRKSEANLHKWLRELLDRDGHAGFTSYSDDFDSENFFGSTRMPILVVGTKLDQVNDKKGSGSKFASDFSSDEIVLDCKQVRYLAAGTSNAVKLSRFFDRVIDSKKNSLGRSFTEKYRSSSVSPTLPAKYYSLHQD